MATDTQAPTPVRIYPRLMDAIQKRAKQKESNIHAEIVLALEKSFKERNKKYLTTK